MIFALTAFTVVCFGLCFAPFLWSDRADLFLDAEWRWDQATIQRRQERIRRDLKEVYRQRDQLSEKEFLTKMHRLEHEYIRLFRLAERIDHA